MASTAPAYKGGGRRRFNEAERQGDRKERVREEAHRRMTAYVPIRAFSRCREAPIRVCHRPRFLLRAETRSSPSCQFSASPFPRPCEGERVTTCGSYESNGDCLFFSFLWVCIRREAVLTKRGSMRRSCCDVPADFLKVERCSAGMGGRGWGERAASATDAVRRRLAWPHRFVAHRGGITLPSDARWICGRLPR